MTTRETIDALNDLIGTCQNGHEGYQAAAGGVRSLRLRRSLGRIALERKAFEEDLAREVRRLGGTPHKHGTFPGALHRGWMDLRRVLGNPEPERVLASCKRGEETALEHYRTVASQSLPQEIADLIRTQLAKITRAREELAVLATEADSEGEL